MTATVAADATNVFPRFRDLDYPCIERGEGVWLYRTDGERILDACSAGAMVACLGHGMDEVVDAAYEQAGAGQTGNQRGTGKAQGKGGHN